MKITITRRNPFEFKNLQEHVERCVNFALGRFSNRISHVGVTLWDENGPRGGNDQVCQIKLSLSRAGRERKNSSIVIAETCSNIQEAVSIAADRASRTVARAIARQRAGSKGAVSASGE